MFCLLALLPFCLSSAQAGEGVRRALILIGSGGDEFYERAFSDWGNRLEALLVREMEVPESRIVRLGDQDSTRTLPISLKTIDAAFNELQSKLTPEDELLLFLIGHGSYIANESRFNIPGRDLTAEALATMLERLNISRLVLVNTTASSAGFINALSAPNRMIVTATKNVNERNATQFAESFLQGMEDGSADQNRDGRISLLEASRQAAQLTAAWFEGQGYLLTEHPLLDDDGDGLGTRLIPETEDDPRAAESHGEGVVLDGGLAGRYFLKDFSFPPEVPEELAQRYTDLLDEVETIRNLKPGMNADEYRARLEPLLIDAARVHREIRQIIARHESGASSTDAPSRKAETIPDVSSQ